MRLVVTGYGTEGQSTIISDGEVDAITDPSRPGFSLSPVWAVDEPATYPGHGTATGPQFPSPSGAKANIVTFPPGHGTKPEPAGLGMHSTDTTDFTFILSGRALLVMEDGTEVVLAAGDTMVQQGTVHEWRVPFDDPCTYAVVLLGAHRE